MSPNDILPTYEMVGNAYGRGYRDGLAVAPIFDIAWRMHDHACDRWRGPEYPGLARPFGTPENMPPHRWRVSRDVLQALYNAMPPPEPIPNPKNGDDGTKRLFGWLVEFDKSAPPGTMLLELATP